MSKKYTYNDVKQYFEENNYLLLSIEYINSHEKLTYQCPHNHIGLINFNDFKNGYRCNQCAILDRADKLRYSYDYIYNYFKDNKCELLEDEYKNSNTKMKYKCSCGNISYITFSSFRQGSRCKDCGLKNRNDPKKYTYDMVYNYFLENNCLLLENEYKNSKEKMKYMCQCGNISYISFHSFKQGVRCAKCAGNERLEFEYVYNKFKDYNYLLLEEKYVNNNTKMKFECDNGHIGYITYSDFIKGSRCVECSHNRKYTFEEVSDYFIKCQCELLSEQYNNVFDKLKYRCECGNISYIAFHDFKKGKRCKICQIEKIRQKLLNPNITQEEREQKRSNIENDIWRKQVFERDNYTCQICGQYGGKLNAHHLDGYHWCKDKRFDINNGIILCENCHDEFHSQFGKKNNTKEQFEEFLRNKNKLSNVG